MQIRWCKTCVETNMRPTTQFNDKGICIACQNTSMAAAERINWEERREVLKDIIAWAKAHNPSGYDCIIGVSGGKDSTRQALFAREIGLNPLLVSCVYPPEQQTHRGAHNLANLISLGFDTITVAPAPKTSKELMRNCLKTYGNLFNASELALYACLPIVAIAYNTPLIFLGENPGLAWGTDVGSLDYNGIKMRNMNTLKGGDPRKFAPPSIPDEMLYWYRYPQDPDLQRAGVRIVYLGYFMPDFNDHTNSRLSVEHGLEVRKGAEAAPENIGGIYDHVALDDDFVIVNQALKYLKFGWGKATQEAGTAIRFGLMTREQGVEVVKKYDGKFARFYLEKLCDYLEMTEEEFWRTVDPYINRELFDEESRGHWRPKFEIR